MKKIPVIIVLGFIFILLLPVNTVAQDEPFIVLEYIQIKPADVCAKPWWYGSLMFNDGINAPYNHIMVVNWGRDNMFDKEPPFDQYRKEDPAAFEGYKWCTRTHRILLHKVVSLKIPAK